MNATKSKFKNDKDLDPLGIFRDFNEALLGLNRGKRKEEEAENQNKKEGGPKARRLSLEDLLP